MVTNMTQTHGLQQEEGGSAPGTRPLPVHHSTLTLLPIDILCMGLQKSSLVGSADSISLPTRVPFLLSLFASTLQQKGRGRNCMTLALPPMKAAWLASVCEYRAETSPL